MRSILNRIVLDNFNDDDITNTKDALNSYISVTLKHRCIKRKLADKGKHNVDDISKVSDEVDSDTRSMWPVISANCRALILIMLTRLHFHVKSPSAKAKYATLKYLTEHRHIIVSHTP